MSDKKKRGLFGAILIAGSITLLVSLLRLFGEYMTWSSAWFNPDAGGPLSIIGIAWLPIVFGFWFGRGLAASGKAPRKPGLALLLCLVGFALLLGGLMFIGSQYKGDELKQMFRYIWIGAPCLTVLALLAWPSAFGANLFYAVLARAPVVAIQYIAIARNMGTHYEKVAPELGQMSADDRAFGLMMAQVTVWVPYTILLGGMFAALGAMTVKKKG